MLYYNTYWTLAFIISFFIYILLYMYSIFISLFGENLRKNVIETGYPEDHVRTQWTLTDYVKWLTNFKGGSDKTAQENS